MGTRTKTLWSVCRTGMASALVAVACSQPKSPGSSQSSPSSKTSPDNDKEETSGTTSSRVKVHSLEQSDGLSVKLKLTDGDEILSLARLAGGTLSAAAKSGTAYVISTESQTVETVKPFFKFDIQATTVLTVSSEYLWVISHGDGMVGRNKLPPDQNKKFEISKVPVSDIFDTAAAVPVHASESQLYFVTGDSLVVLTFAGNAINRKMVPFPGGELQAKEYVLGAGPLGEPGTSASYWMITNQRLLRFAGTKWVSKDAAVKGESEDPWLVAMVFGDKDAEDEDEAYSLFGGNTVADLKSRERTVNRKTEKDSDDADDDESPDEDDEDGGEKEDDGDRGADEDHEEGDEA